MVSTQEIASISILACMLTYWLVIGAYYFYQSTKYDASRELIEACVIQLKRGAKRDKEASPWTDRIKFFQIWLIFLQYAGLLWKLIQNDNSEDTVLKWFVMVTTLNSMAEGFLVYMSMYFAVYLFFFLWYGWLQYKAAYRIGSTSDWLTYMIQVLFLQWLHIPAISCFLSVSGCQWDGETRKLDAGTSNLECFEDVGSVFAVVFAVIFFCVLYTAALENRLKEDKWYMTYIIQPRYTVVQAIISTFLIYVLVSFSTFPKTACGLVTGAFFLMGGFCLYTQPALGNGREINHHLVASLFGISWIGMFCLIYLIADFESWIMYVIIGSTTPLAIGLSFLASMLWLKRQDKYQIRQCGTLVKFHASATEETLSAARSFAVLSLVDDYRDTLCTTVALECVPLYKNFIVGHKIEQLDVDVLSWLTRGLANIASSSSESRQKLIDTDIMPYLFRFLNARASESVKRTGMDKTAVTVLCNLAVETKFATWLLANQKHLRTLVDRIKPSTSSKLKSSGIHESEVRAFSANTILNVLKKNDDEKKPNIKISRAFSSADTLKKLRGLLNVQEWEIRIRGLHIFYYLAKVKENAPKLTGLQDFVNTVGELALNDLTQDIRDSAICVLQALNKHAPGIFKGHKELKEVEVTLPVLQNYALDLDFSDISHTLKLHKKSANNLDEYSAMDDSRSDKSNGTSTSATPEVDVIDVYRERLKKIYKKHNAKKVDLIDGWLERNKDNPHALYVKICEKYNKTPEPKVDLVDDNGGGNLGDASSYRSSKGDASYQSWARSPSKNPSFLKQKSLKNHSTSKRRNLFQATPKT